MGRDGIDVVPVDVVDLALLDVTLNGIDRDDVSFRIRSPHRAEASLCMSRVSCVRGHFSFKEGPPSGGGLWWFVVGYCEWCHSSPVLGASIEDGAVELAYGGGLNSEHA